MFLLYRGLLLNIITFKMKLYNNIRKWYELLLISFWIIHDFHSVAKNELGECIVPRNNKYEEENVNLTQ